MFVKEILMMVTLSTFQFGFGFNVHVHCRHSNNMCAATTNETLQQETLKIPKHIIITNEDNKPLTPHPHPSPGNKQWKSMQIPDGHDNGNDLNELGFSKRFTNRANSE